MTKLVPTKVMLHYNKHFTIMEDALNLWPLLGNEYKIISEDLKSGYICWFIKDRTIVGEFKAKGSFSWNYPQELVDAINRIRKSDISVYEYCNLLR